MTTLHHFYICLKDFENSKKFYEELFEILNFKLISSLQEFQLFVYGNSNIHVGIMPIGKDFEDDNWAKFRIGITHYAFGVDSQLQMDSVVNLVKKYSLKYDALNEVLPHHKIEMLSTVFYCPSGMKIEIVKK